MNHSTALYWDSSLPKEILSVFESLNKIQCIENTKINFSVITRWAKIKDVEIKQI